jgi:hypothetical protein
VIECDHVKVRRSVCTHLAAGSTRVGHCAPLQLVMQLVMNRGDTFLVEGFAYSHLLEGVSEPHGYNPLPVPIDDDGILPDGLRQVCQMVARLLAARILCWQASHCLGPHARWLAN